MSNSLSTIICPIFYIPVFYFLSHLSHLLSHIFYIFFFISYLLFYYRSYLLSSLSSPFLLSQISYILILTLLISIPTISYTSSPIIYPVYYILFISPVSFVSYSLSHTLYSLSSAFYSLCHIYYPLTRHI